MHTHAHCLDRSAVASVRIDTAARIIQTRLTKVNVITTVLCGHYEPHLEPTLIMKATIVKIG